MCFELGVGTYWLVTVFSSYFYRTNKVSDVFESVVTIVHPVVSVYRKRTNTINDNYGSYEYVFIEL